VCLNYLKIAQVTDDLSGNITILTTDVAELKKTNEDVKNSNSERDTTLNDLRNDDNIISGAISEVMGLCKTFLNEYNALHEALSGLAGTCTKLRNENNATRSTVNGIEETEHLAIKDRPRTPRTPSRNRLASKARDTPPKSKTATRRNRKGISENRTPNTRSSVSPMRSMTKSSYSARRLFLREPC